MNGCCSGFVNLRNRLLILYGSLNLLLVSSGYPELVLFFLALGNFSLQAKIGFLLLLNWNIF